MLRFLAYALSTTTVFNSMLIRALVMLIPAGTLRLLVPRNPNRKLNS
jgi:hypothetical protein